MKLCTLTVLMAVLALAMCSMAREGPELQDEIVAETQNWADEDEPVSEELVTMGAKVHSADDGEFVVKQGSASLAKALSSACASSTILAKKPWVPKMCKKLVAGPVKAMLDQSLGELADAKLESYDDDSITFKIGKVKIGQATFQFTGTIGYDDKTGILSISAQNQQEREVNKFVKFSKLNLGVSVDTKAKKLKSAEIDGTATVSFGFGDSTSGSVLISLGKGGLKVKATLETQPIQLSPTFKLTAGTVDLAYAKKTMVVKLDAKANVIYSSKNSPLELAIEGSYDGETSSIEMAGTMDSMIPNVFGLGIVSVGKLALTAKLKKGAVKTASISGVLCVGASSECDKGKASEKNLIALLSLRYKASKKKASAGWTFWAQSSQLDLKKAIHVFGDSSIADKVPDLLNVGFKPLQSGCKPNSPIEECFFVIAVSNKGEKLQLRHGAATGLSGGSCSPDSWMDWKEKRCYQRCPSNSAKRVQKGKFKGNCKCKKDSDCMSQFKLTCHDDVCKPAPTTISIAPGLTLLANVQLLKKPARLHLNMPINGAKVLLPGSSTKKPKYAKFKAMLFDAKTKAKILMLGQASNSKKMVYDMKFSKVLPLVVDACSKGIPGAGGLKLPSFIKKPLAVLDKMMDKYDMAIEMHQDFKKKSKVKYFSVTGSAFDGKLALTIMVNRRKVRGKTATGILAAVVLNSQFFGKLMKGMLGTDPFEKMPLFSNFNVAGYISNSDMLLPAGVSLPVPFHEIQNIKKGFCFDGRLGRPVKSCGKNDPVCTLASKAMGKSSSLTLKGCVNAGSVSLSIGISAVKLSKNVKIRFAGLTFATETGPPPSVQFGAECTLDVVMNKQPVAFIGKLYVKQAGPSTVIGFSFAVVGMIAKAFGLKKLHMYDLILAAEVGVVATAPVINSLTIGGGICFGPLDRCKFLVQGKSQEELIQQGISTTPQHRDYEEHLALVQKAKVTGAVAAKLYAGFDTSGSAFFYAGITKVTLADVASAFVGADKLPAWLGKVGLGPYDPAACKKSGGAACFAYMSFATKDHTIKELSPPMTIPMGFNIQGRLHMFGAQMGFQLNFAATRLKMKLDSSPLKLFGGKIMICAANSAYKVGLDQEHHETQSAARSLLSGVTSDESTTMIASRGKPYDCSKGPSFKLDANLKTRDFKMGLNGYAKIKGLGEAGAIVKVSNKEFGIKLINVPVFFTPIRMNLEAKIQMAGKKKGIMIAASLTSLPKVMEPLQKLTRKAIKPLTSLQRKVAAAKKSVYKSLNNAKAKLNKAKTKVNKAAEKCKAATRKVAAKKSKCNFLMLQISQAEKLPTEKARKARVQELMQEFGRQEAQENFEQAMQPKDQGLEENFEQGLEVAGWGSRRRRRYSDTRRRRRRYSDTRRRRRSRNIFSRAFKAVKKTAKKGASYVCKKAIKVASKLMNAACTAGKSIANKALRVAQNVVRKAQKVVNAALSLASAALRGALSAIEFLTKYTVNELGFKLSSIKPSVSLRAVIKNTKTNAVKTYKFHINLSGGNLGKIAKAMFKKAFAAIKEAALKSIKNLIKKMGFNVRELIQMDTVDDQNMRELHQAGLLQDMDLLEFVPKEALSQAHV